MNYQKNYYPRRPVKSFQDLEVYQKLLAISVAITKKIKSEKISVMALELPVKVATAHSLRFNDQEKAIQILEEVMLNCNILVVYLEQYRDIELPAAEVGRSLESRSQSPREDRLTVEPEFFEEQIKNLLTTRMKILHLQFSWKKFMEQKKKEQNV